MESKKIYESSKAELNKIKKELSTDNVTIDFTKLDYITKGKIISALQNTIAERYPKVEENTLGVN